MSFEFEKMKWISVKDQMPAINTWCAVLKNDYIPSARDIAFFLECREGYYFCIGRDVKQSWSPTHWMLLPEPPKE